MNSFENSSVDLRALIDTLSTLYRSGSSGTLYLTTPQNHSAHIVFLDGKVSYSFFRSRRGKDAFEALKDFDQFKLRYVNETTTTSEQELPDTQSLLAILNGEKSANTSSTPSYPSDRHAASSDHINADPAHLRNLISDAATDLFGPVGMLLCDEAMEVKGLPESRSSLIALLDAIATEGGEPQKRDDLLARVNQGLK